MSDDAEDRMKHKAEGGRSGVTGNRPGWWGRAWRGMMISNHASDFARASDMMVKASDASRKRAVYGAEDMETWCGLDWIQEWILVLGPRCSVVIGPSLPQQRLKASIPRRQDRESSLNGLLALVSQLSS